MLLKDAVQYLHEKDREEITKLISRWQDIEDILTYDANCDRIALVKERRRLRKRAAILLAKVEALRQELEKEEYNDRKDISPKRERKSLGLFRKRKKKGVGGGI